MASALFVAQMLMFNLLTSLKESEKLFLFGAIRQPSAYFFIHSHQNKTFGKRLNAFLKDRTEGEKT